MSLADRLKQARSSLHKEQKELAAMLGISFRSWQDYELGKSVPGGKVFEALVNHGLNANWLLVGEGPMMRDKVEVEGQEVPSSQERGDREKLEEKAMALTSKDGNSPIKAAAHSYIDAMPDSEAAKIVEIIIDRNENPFLRLSPEGKAEARAIAESHLKEIDERTSSGSDQKITGT
jgi:transcriptional regulator with XRE-family HTH domain